MRFLTRRLVHGMVLLAGVSLLSFLLVQFVPGDFFQTMSLDPQISPTAIAALSTRYGLGRPLPVRYFLWLKSAVEGDLGFSFAYNSPVSSLLMPRVRNTLILTATATLLAWLLAVPIGVWSASWRGTWRDRICGTATSGLLAVPDLLVALALLMIAVRTGRFPAGGMQSPASTDLPPLGRMLDVLSHLFLPCMALVLIILPVLVRHVRAAVIETLDAPFVRTALAHGISRRRILWRHVLPASVNPLISLFGMSAGSLLSSSLLVEVIMNWPGLGPLVLEAIFARDIYLVMGSLMLSTILLLAGNFLADLLLYAAEPRIRREAH